MTRDQRDLLSKQIDARARERLAAQPKFGGSHAGDVPKKAGAGEGATTRPQPIAGGRSSPAA